MSCPALSALLLFTGLSEARGEGPVLAVFGVHDRAAVLADDEREQLTRYIAARMAEGGAYQVVPEAELRRALDAQKQESYQACYDEECQVQIGRELAAQKSLLTEIVRLGDSCGVTMTLLDLAKAASEQAATKRGGCDINALVGLVEGLTARIKNPGEGVPLEEVRPKDSPTTARSVARKSPTRFRFDTNERKRAFSVELFSPDGETHRCGEEVRIGMSCLIENVAFGEAMYKVHTEGLDAFSDTLDVEDEREMMVLELKEVASPGNIIAWTMGGVASVAGVALIATGAGTNLDGLVYGGVPTLAVGLAVLAVGFVIEGRVDVSESSHPF